MNTLLPRILEDDEFPLSNEASCEFLEDIGEFGETLRDTIPTLEMVHGEELHPDGTFIWCSSPNKDGRFSGMFTHPRNEE